MGGSDSRRWWALAGVTYGFIGISGGSKGSAGDPADSRWLTPPCSARLPYTWGVVLMSVAVLAMIGALFVMPQYFQGVLGTNAMGSGVRLLPLIGGLIIGALLADRIARRVGCNLTVSLGCAVLAGGLLLGGATDMGATDAFLAVWMAVAEAGMGSAVLQALKNVGDPSVRPC